MSEKDIEQSKSNKHRKIVDEHEVSAEVKPTRPREILLPALVDLIQYSIGITVLICVPSLLLSVTVSAGLTGLKYALFVCGFLLFGYATFLLQPSKPWKENDQQETRQSSSFESVIRQLPPANSLPIPPEARFNKGEKLFVTSIVILTISYLLEVVLGVPG